MATPLLPPPFPSAKRARAPPPPKVATQAPPYLDGRQLQTVDGSPRPSQADNIDLSQPDHTPHSAPCDSSSAHRLQSCNDSLSQRLNRLPQESNHSQCQENNHSAGAQSPTPAFNEPAAAPSQALSAVMLSDVFEQELLELAGLIYMYIIVRFPNNFAPVPTSLDDLNQKSEELFEHIWTDLRDNVLNGTQLHAPTELRAGPDRAEEWADWDNRDHAENIGNDIAYRLWKNPVPEPVAWRSYEPEQLEDGSLWVEIQTSWRADSKSLKDLGLRISGLTVSEVAATPTEASLDTLETASTDSQESTDSFQTAYSYIDTACPAGQGNNTSTGLATPAGSDVEASRSSRDDTTINDPSPHPFDNEDASGQPSVDPRALEKWISSPDFDPTFECIVLLCRARFDTKDGLRRHLLHDHAGIFQGNTAHGFDARLNASALEVCFGGKVPPFAQEYIHEAYRTAYLNPGGPMTTLTFREGAETIPPVAIDTVSVSIDGQNTTDGHKTTGRR